jgi:tetratricopeptide (TPR) repeat protein
MLAYCQVQLDRALDLLRRSLEADPLSMIGPVYIARTHYAAGRLQEAEAECRATLARSTTPSREHAMLAMILVDQGRLEEALAEANAEMAPWAKLWSLATVEWALGKKAEADAALAELEREHGESAAFQVAQVHAHRGDFDGAFEWLERAYTLHDAGIALLNVSPQMAPLRSDPRWTVFLRRVGMAA